VTDLDDADGLAEALAGVEFTDDLHGSSDYRRHLAVTLGARAARRAKEAA
jgi:CO/xanthine dehydrogenase FAD-binding subunit